MPSRRRQALGVILSAIILAISLYPPVRQIICLPEHAVLVVGEDEPLGESRPSVLWRNLAVHIMDPNRAAFSPSATPPVVLRQEGSVLTLHAISPGQARVELRAFGYIPIRQMSVTTAPRTRVLVGGHSVGIILQSEGIMVVGYASIARDGQRTCPARDAGIQIGDLITQVNGVPVGTEGDLAAAVDEAGKKGQPVTVGVRRMGKVLDLRVLPLYCGETERYRIGLYVRDGVAGVGTLSFVDPQTGQFAALGHVILDADTQQRINVKEGKLVQASVQTIQPGRPGRPGEKIGVFKAGEMLRGYIEKNTYYGIFGQLEKGVTNPIYPEPLEVAYAHQVHTGPAKMLTVLGGDEVQEFDIVVEKVYPSREDSKGIVLRVVDPRVISVAGGIVQGMSGSPIVQDGRLAGVVTNVFLNDPLRGYGTFIDNMLREMRDEEDFAQDYRQGAA